MKNIIKKLALTLFAAVVMVGCSDKAEKYTITVKSNNDAWGTVMGGGEYEEGMAAEIAARPNVGYVFKQWEDGNTDNPRVVAVKGDATYTAVFGEPGGDTPGGGDIPGGGDQPADTNTKFVVTLGDTTFHVGFLIRQQVSMGGGQFVYQLTGTNDTEGNDIQVTWMWNGEVGTDTEANSQYNLCNVVLNNNDFVTINGQQLPHYLSVDDLTVNVTRYDAATNSIDCTVTGRLLDMSRVSQGLSDEYISINVVVESFRLTDYNQ